MVTMQVRISGIWQHSIFVVHTRLSVKNFTLNPFLRTLWTKSICHINNFHNTFWELARRSLHLISLYEKKQRGYLRINLLCSMEEITNFLNYKKLRNTGLESTSVIQFSILNLEYSNPSILASHTVFYDHSTSPKLSNKYPSTPLRCYSIITQLSPHRIEMTPITDRLKASSTLVSWYFAVSMPGGRFTADATWCSSRDKVGKVGTSSSLCA